MRTLVPFFVKRICALENIIKVKIIQIKLWIYYVLYYYSEHFKIFENYNFMINTKFLKNVLKFSSLSKAFNKITKGDELKDFTKNKFFSKSWGLSKFVFN